MGRSAHTHTYDPSGEGGGQGGCRPDRVDWAPSGVAVGGVVTRRVPSESIPARVGVIGRPGENRGSGG